MNYYWMTKCKIEINMSQIFQDKEINDFLSIKKTRNLEGTNIVLYTSLQVPIMRWNDELAKIEDGRMEQSIEIVRDSEGKPLPGNGTEMAN